MSVIENAKAYLNNDLLIFHQKISKNFLQIFLSKCCQKKKFPNFYESVALNFA